MHLRFIRDERPDIRADLPVLVARGWALEYVTRDQLTSAAMVDIKRILCPVDFSEFSQRALDYAVAIARQYEASVSALHVYHLVTPAVGVAPYVGPEAL